jgi:hypothetical protein
MSKSDSIRTSVFQKRDTLEKLFIAWMRKPEMKLGQLLCQSLPSNSGKDLYTVDDQDLTEAVHLFAEQRYKTPVARAYFEQHTQPRSIKAR